MFWGVLKLIRYSKLQKYTTVVIQELIWETHLSDMGYWDVLRRSIKCNSSIKKYLQIEISNMEQIGHAALWENALSEMEQALTNI